METTVKQEKELWNSPSVEVLSIKDETKGGANAGDDVLEQS